MRTLIGTNRFEAANCSHSGKIEGSEVVANLVVESRLLAPTSPDFIHPETKQSRIEIAIFAQQQQVPQKDVFIK